MSQCAVIYRFLNKYVCRRLPNCPQLVIHRRLAGMVFHRRRTATMKLVTDTSTFLRNQCSVLSRWTESICMLFRTCTHLRNFDFTEYTYSVVAIRLIMFGQPFVKRFALCYRTVVLSCPVCPVCLSVCKVDVLWPNGWTDQDDTRRARRPGPWPHCVRWGPSSPPQKWGGAPSPIFSPCLLWPNGWMDQDGTWHRGGPWSRLHCAKPPPQFSAHFYCGQTAGCIKMPLYWYM